MVGFAAAFPALPRAMPTEVPKILILTEKPFQGARIGVDQGTHGMIWWRFAPQLSEVLAPHPRAAHVSLQGRAVGPRAQKYTEYFFLQTLQTTAVFYNMDYPQLLLLLMVPPHLSCYSNFLKCVFSLQAANCRHLAAISWSCCTGLALHSLGIHFQGMVNFNELGN